MIVVTDILLALGVSTLASLLVLAIVVGMAAATDRHHERRKAQREARQAEREAHMWSEIAELEMEYSLPSAPGSPRWTR